MQADQRRRTIARQVGVVVGVVEMHDVDVVMRKHVVDFRAHLPMHARPGKFVLRAEVCYRYQLPGDARTTRGDNDRAVPVGHERAIELRNHLFGAADRVMRDRREGVGDVEDRKAQNVPRNSNSLIAAAARVCQIAVPIWKSRRS